ncbi:MAG TPA: GNAT family N-acetyltransferase [Thermoanaerobaculia bacterium]|jgi:GNAT superfamily N-acetyltransferase
MIQDISILRLHELSHDGLAGLVAESEAAGHRFLRRLIDEWDGGTNRFCQPGEALFAAVAGGRMVGLCGLSVDPYCQDARVGRVRHLYVLRDFRRQGIATRLLDEVVAAARGTFDRLRLRTEDESAARFYGSFGFRACSGVLACTHVLELAES